MRRLESILPLLLLISIVLSGCKKPEADKNDIQVLVDGGGSRSVPDELSVQEVKLTIDTGAPKVAVVKIPYVEKMTVRDLLKAAEAQGITAVYQGEGEGAMLQSLQGVSNQGGGQDAKNWIYYVNNKQGTTSSAVYSLQPGDSIRWNFEKYE